jgi:hypothetical protein
MREKKHSSWLGACKTAALPSGTIIELYIVHIAQRSSEKHSTFLVEDLHFNHIYLLMPETVSSCKDKSRRNKGTHARAMLISDLNGRRRNRSIL